jgi:hypothetical protein
VSTLILLAVLTASGSEAEAEARRLQIELANLASRSQWSGVERTFRALAATGVAPSAEALIAAASAAEATGDLSLCRARLLAAKDAEGDLSLLDPWIVRIDRQYGHVSIIADKMSLIPEQQPFGSVDRLVVERAATAIADEGTYQGFLPPGRYLIGGNWLEVQAGAKVDVDFTVKRRRSMKKVLGIEEDAP